MPEVTNNDNYQPMSFDGDQDRLGVSRDPSLDGLTER